MVSFASLKEERNEARDSDGFSDDSYHLSAAAFSMYDRNHYCTEYIIHNTSTNTISYFFLVKCVFSKGLFSLSLRLW